MTRARYLAIVGALGVLSLGAVMMSPAASAQPETMSTLWWWPDPISNGVPDADYVHGNLTWNQAAGGIDWSRNPATDETTPLASGDPVPQASAWVGWTLQANTGGAVGGELVPAITFTSEPFPETVYVDVGMPVHINLMVQNTGSCAASTLAEMFSLEARINGDIWGGVPAERMAGMDANDADPSPPSGWCYAPFRFHSEAVKIDEGDVLEVTIFFHHLGGTSIAAAPTIGFGGDHASTIHVPTYPWDEAVFRRPELQNDGPRPVLLGLGGTALLAFWATPAGKRRAFLAFLLIVPALAGCSSADSDNAQDEDDDEKPQYTIEGDPAGANSTDPGRIVGVVMDPAAVAIKGAHFALLGTDFSASTDDRGRFSLDALPQGEYAYRVDHRGHRAVEDKVEVEGGRVTRLTVPLPWLENRTADEIAHAHNLWPPSGRKTLLDTEIVDDDLVCHNLVDVLLFPGVGQTYSHCRYRFHLPLPERNEKPISIYPGTERLEATVTWQGGNLERLGFYFIPNGEPYPDSDDHVNLTAMWPRESGETTTIPLTWEMADPGHQRFSSWEEIGLWAPLGTGGTAVGAGPDVRVLVAEGPIHVKLEIVKGVVPLERPHPDHWKGKDALVIMDGGFGNTLNLVPPETKWLEIELEQDREPVGEHDVQLVYSPGDVPRFHPDGADKDIVVEFPDEQGLVRRVAWPLLDGEADAAYAVTSNWRFYGRETNDPIADADEQANGHVMYTLNVVAHRTGVPDDAAER